MKLPASDHDRIVRLQGELESLRRELALELKAMTEANAKAASALSIRLEAMNQFRDQLREQAGTFVSSSTLEDKLDTIRALIEAARAERMRELDDQSKRVSALEKAENRVSGRDSTINAFIVAGLALAAVVADIALRASGH